MIAGHIVKTNIVVLTYTHDHGLTTHVVQILPDNRYLCFINGAPCFQRGTHQSMLRVAGYDPNKMHASLTGETVSV